MSDIPRTDAARHDKRHPYMAVASECAKLERELNAANERIKWLEEAIVNERNKYNLLADDVRAVIKAWTKAKEAKP